MTFVVIGLYESLKMSTKNQQKRADVSSALSLEKGRPQTGKHTVRTQYAHSTHPASLGFYVVSYPSSRSAVTAIARLVETRRFNKQNRVQGYVIERSPTHPQRRFVLVDTLVAGGRACCR